MQQMWHPTKINQSLIIQHNFHTKFTLHKYNIHKSAINSTKIDKYKQFQIAKEMELEILVS